MRSSLEVVFGAVALAAATPSLAAITLVPGGTCNRLTPNPDATACAGAYAGNLLNSNSIGDINLALDALVGGNFAPDVTWSTLDPTKALFTGSGNDPTGTITFAALTGDVILGVHFGDAGTGLGDRTIFYRFNFTSPTTTVVLNTQGFSDAVLIRGTAVPEPATWAMMLIGFGAIGFALRRRPYSLPQPV